MRTEKAPKRTKTHHTQKQVFDWNLPEMRAYDANTKRGVPMHCASRRSAVIQTWHLIFSANAWVLLSCSISVLGLALLPVVPRLITSSTSERAGCRLGRSTHSAAGG